MRVETKTTFVFVAGDVVKADPFVWVRLRDGKWTTTDMNDGWHDPDSGVNDDDFEKAYLSDESRYQFLTLEK